MSTGARRGGRLKDTVLTFDDLMLSFPEVQENSSGESPLQFLSPPELNKRVSGESGNLSLEEQKIKANYLLEDEEAFAPLPKFNKRKVDPRRQSTATFYIS